MTAQPPMPLPAPLGVPSATAPDRDFAALAAEALGRLPELAPAWTDHNPGDPGITLLEAMLWAVADLHYRTGNRALDGWSAEVGLYREVPGRHWSGVPLPADPTRLRALADALAGLPGDVRAAVRTVGAPLDAERAVADAAPGLVAAEVRAAVRLLRAPLVLAVALDDSDVIATVAATVSGGGTSDGSAVAVALRAAGVGPRLWDEELAAVARHRRRADLARRLNEAAGRVRELVAAAADRMAAETALTGEFGLDAAEARDALGLHPAPPGARPEDWERGDGETTAWPPHPLQVRTVEPVTTGDYARLAAGVVDRSIPSRPVTVRRVWAVPAVLPGIAWDGTSVGTAASRLGAITLLVEPDDPEALDTEPRRRAFLTSVLRQALAGPGETAEIDDPYEPVHLDLDRLAPRRMICDEVGAALLEYCRVTLRGVIYVPVSSSRQQVLDGALDRIKLLFAAGRPETAVSSPDPGYPRDLDGPWPSPGVVATGPSGGWWPGEPIRIAELVQVIMRDPGVLGVDDLAATTDDTTTDDATGGATWHAEELPLAANGVPFLGGHQCLTIRLELREECGDGC
ncbi:hypothetical protein OG884_03975 [Streptosporangium sp. NBC_01755]|uniref:hypothetical protein n=1 Tax=Streptosporangium sp. NBC_01755 TaxID=2975949 RepID=UPI002DD9B6FF|nr:hypothetical protein [Streptosporangium sp. NBC_01755]WSD01104.1 hypothetical protein OG884_03975 [Streptosporangium sp. NBC_01755]